MSTIVHMSGEVPAKTSTSPGDPATELVAFLRQCATDLESAAAAATGERWCTALGVIRPGDNPEGPAPNIGMLPLDADATAAVIGRNLLAGHAAGVRALIAAAEMLPAGSRVAVLRAAATAFTGWAGWTSAAAPHPATPHVPLASAATAAQTMMTS